MSAGQIPPWLQEQVMKMQQSEQNLQAILNQKQHIELEKLETEKALEELKKVADGDSVFKQTGLVMIKSEKQPLIDELEEKIEMGKTRIVVLSKQETRLRESLKEQEAKITAMMRGSNNAPGSGTGATNTPSPNFPPKQSPPPPSSSNNGNNDNPRK